MGLPICCPAGCVGSPPPVATPAARVATEVYPASPRLFYNPAHRSIVGDAPPPDAPSTEPPSPTPAPSPAAEPPKRKLPGHPNYPAEENVRRIKEVLRADPKASKTKLRAKVGVSPQTIEKYIDIAIADLNKEGGWPPAETPASAPASPAATAPTQQPQPSAPATATSPQEPIPFTLDPAGEALFKDFQETAKDLPAALSEKLLGDLKRFYLAITKATPLSVAQVAVDQKEREDLAREALRNTTWALQAGRGIRRWYDKIGPGLEFESPGELVETALSFLFENRDELPRLRRELAEREEVIDAMAQELSPYYRRQQAVDKVMQLIGTYHMMENPLPNSTVAVLLANANAAGDPRAPTFDELMTAAQVVT
jgi:hypothetical protein